MNIRYVQELLSRIDEIKIISKTAEIDGVVCNVVGLVRYGMQLRLIIIEYNEQYRQQMEELEISEICNVRQAPETNRVMFKGKERFVQPLRPIRGIIIGDIEFSVSGSEGRHLNFQDGESILILSELLRSGWNPEGIDYQNIDTLFMTSYELIGDFATIPGFKNNPILHFIMGKDTVTHIVEQPITLTVNNDYHEKLWFKNVETGEEHWAQINRVYLLDMWAEMEKTFSEPKHLEHMTKEQITDAKKAFEEQFIKICPKRMFYPIVEYECDESISLEFHTKKFLNSKPINKNKGIGFIVGAEKPTGILGMKLRSAIIQEPMNANIVSIEAELFQYHKTTIPEDIII